MCAGKGTDSLSGSPLPVRGKAPGQQRPGHTSAPAPPRPRASVQPPFRASGHGEWAVGPVGAIRQHKAEGLAAQDMAGEASLGKHIIKALPAPLTLPGARLCNLLMLQVAPTQPSENSAYTQEMGLTTPARPTHMYMFAHACMHTHTHHCPEGSRGWLWHQSLQKSFSLFFFFLNAICLFLSFFLL